MNPIKKNKIQKTLRETRDRRNSMTCKVIECKIVSNSLSNSTRTQLNKLFLEAKWFYNSIIASDNISKFNTKINCVPVKVKETFEQRDLLQISAQMKQGLHTRIFNSMSILKSLKSKGYKTGKLKFKSNINCIPLKQHTQTYTILKNSKRIKIQGIKQPLRVSGLNQLPKIYEIANANLVKVGNDYYVKITLYIPNVPKQSRNVPTKSIGIDFGCQTQLTLSNGEKIEYQVPISNRVKILDKAITRSVKGSRNRNKLLRIREQEYHKLNNKRGEIKNQIVNKLVKNYSTICFQDENISAWKASGHGKKIQFSAIGGIISALQCKAATPIVVNKYHPSTQICSKCGNKQKVALNERTYLCHSCETTIDRDINSAINIEKEGLKQIPTERREFKPVEINTPATFDSNENLNQKSKSLSAKQETAISLVLQ